MSPSKSEGGGSSSDDNLRYIKWALIGLGTLLALYKLYSWFSTPAPPEEPDPCKILDGCLNPCKLKWPDYED